MKKGLLIGGITLLLVVNTHGQEIGIGTSNPVARLHIEATNGYSKPLLRIEKQGTAVPYLVISADGKVGVNINSPTEVLDVGGNISFSGALMPTGNAGSPGQVLVSQGPGLPPQWTTMGGSGGVAGICNTAMAGFMQKWTGSELCNSVVFDDGINVGIGTTNPGSKLHVAGDSTVLIVESSNNVVRIKLVNSTSSTLGEYIGTVDSNVLIYTKDTPRVIITAEGQVGIGIDTPSERLDVGGNIEFSGALMPGGSAGSPGQVLVSQGPGLPPQWQYLGGAGLGTCALGITPCVDTAGNPSPGSCPTMTLAQCVNACAQSTYGGFNDWHIPSLDEFTCIKAQGYSFSDPSNIYWTRTPFHDLAWGTDSGNFPSSGGYCYFRPSDGRWTGIDAGNSLSCICVR